MNRGVLRRANLLLSFLVATATASTLGAQVTMRVDTHTALTAGSKSIAANTNVTAGVSLADRRGAPCYESGSLDVIVSSPTTVRMRAGSSHFAACSAVLGAAGSIRIKLTASKPTAGFVVAQGDCPGGISGFSIDVSNDGTKELIAQSQFRGQRILETPLVVGPSGVDIVVRCHAFINTFTSSVSADVTLRFVAGTSSPHLQVIGNACGPELSARFVQTQPFFPVRSFTLDVSKARQTSSWFVFGMRQTNITIPPTRCKLYTDILVPFWTVVGPTGRASLPIRIPSGTSNALAYVQFVQATLVANRMEWTTSQAMRLRL